MNRSWQLFDVFGQVFWMLALLGSLFWWSDFLIYLPFVLGGWQLVSTGWRFHFGQEIAKIYWRIFLPVFGIMGAVSAILAVQDSGKGVMTFLFFLLVASPIFAVSYLIACVLELKNGV